MRSGMLINSLDELINESIRLDNKLYKLALETRPNNYRRDKKEP
jgi:hypothetical protein